MLDRPAIQVLLASFHGKPEGFAINLAVLKSLSRAEYSPEVIGHYALASEHYAHFTSPIRRYADLTIHRLLDAFFSARGENPRTAKKRPRIDIDDVPSYDELVQTGRHLSFTERRADDAERELRQVKILELLTHQIGNEFTGVVTGITNFGIFVQIQAYLIDGLIRYEDLMDDWWDVDEKSGQVRGQRTGQVIRIGDVVKTVIVRVDLPRRELGIAITELPERIHKPKPGEAPPKGAPRGAKGNSNRKGAAPRGGAPRGGGRVQSRSGKPPMGKPKNKGPKKRGRR